MVKLMESIYFMSAGTIGSLTGLNTYDEIYEAKEKFKEFAERLPEDLTWQEAWHKYLAYLWGELENVPVDQKAEKIECDFFVWKSGEAISTIWGWFNKKYPGGLESLI